MCSLSSLIQYLSSVQITPHPHQTLRIHTWYTFAQNRSTCVFKQGRGRGRKRKKRDIKIKSQWITRAYDDWHSYDSAAIINADLKSKKEPFLKIYQWSVMKAKLWGMLTYQRSLYLAEGNTVSSAWRRLPQSSSTYSEVLWTALLSQHDSISVGFYVRVWVCVGFACSIYSIYRWSSLIQTYKYTTTALLHHRRRRSPVDVHSLSIV